MDARSRSLDPLSLRLLAAVALFVVLAAAMPANAQAPDALVLLPRCEDPFGGERFRRLLALELSLANVDTMEAREIGDGEELPQTDALLTVRIEASCEVGGRAIISASGGPGTASVHQVLDLIEVDPGTRARAIAVATAEQVRLQHLLAERAAERATIDGPAARPSSSNSVMTPREAARQAAVPSSDAASDARSVEGDEPADTGPEASGAQSAVSQEGDATVSESPRGSLWFAFEARGFPELATWPLGLRLGAAFVVAPLYIGFDAGAGFASAEHARGRVEMWALTAGISVGARWQPIPEVGVTPNLRADFGYVSLTGFPTEGEPRSGQGASVVMVVSLRVDAALGDRFQLIGDIDVGPTLLGNVARADMEEDVAGAAGVALAFRLGFAFTL